MEISATLWVHVAREGHLSLSLSLSLSPCVSLPDSCDVTAWPTLYVQQCCYSDCEDNDDDDNDGWLNEPSDV